MITVDRRRFPGGEDADQAMMVGGLSKSEGCGKRRLKFARSPSRLRPF
jgi:hypothetical protein